PARQSPAPRITTAPIRCAASNFAAAAKSAVGSMLTMSPPKLRFLAARIALTFMAASLAHDFFRKHHARKTRTGSQPGLWPDIMNDRADGVVPSRWSYKRELVCVASWLMPHCSRILELRKMRRRIEPGKQQQPRKEAADMRLPRYGMLAAGNRQRPQSEQNIDTEPHRQEKQHTRIRQYAA